MLQVSVLQDSRFSDPSLQGITVNGVEVIDAGLPCGPYGGFTSCDTGNLDSYRQCGCVGGWAWLVVEVALA